MARQGETNHDETTREDGTDDKEGTELVEPVSHRYLAERVNVYSHR